MTGASRRGFIASAGAVVGALSTGRAFAAGPAAPPGGAPAVASVSLHGPHQNGIATPTPMQGHTCFAALDIAATGRQAIVDVLQAWTVAAGRMAQGRTAAPPSGALADAEPDSWDALGLEAARLTITFGFGPDLFLLDGKDRFDLAARRPAALVDLPVFPGDQLLPAYTGGALSIQACADDPQVAFHAVRELVRLGKDAVAVRWMQTGYSTANRVAGTPRNLMGFKDGTINPSSADPASMTGFVWVGSEGPGWMQGGSYAVFRRIRIALQHWDQMPRGFQEQTIGRHKLSGAPLGCAHERDPLDLDATDKDGAPLIPATAHARLTAPQENGGAQILRRSYGYSDGASFTAERWPPWKQAMEYDAGLMFIAYQRDPRTGFIPMFEKLSRLDALNQFTTHVGSAIFACPGGIRAGEYIGQSLFEPA
ncbi:MAG: Dyp-type peroxidase [Proteobacteria bacterium]|nr:Dyp-type peroxidase [Pseudomonadota bacterium]